MALGLALSPLTAALAAAAAALAAAAYWFCVSTFGYWKERGVPYAPPTPFLGNIADVLLMRRSFNEVHQDLYNRFQGQPFAGIYHARQPALLLRDPELIKGVLVRDFAHFHDRGILIHEDRYPLQQHLFNLPGARWRALRNKLSPTFTSGRIKHMFAVVEECSRHMVQHVRPLADGEQVVEMKEVLAKFSTDVIGTCAFGLQMNALQDPDSEFRQMGRKVFQPNAWTKFALVTNSLIPELGRVLKLDDFSAGVSDFFLRVVKETVEHRVRNKIVRNDFLQLLINLRRHGHVDDNDNDNDNDDGTDEEKHAANGAANKGKDAALDFELDDGLMAAQAFVFFLAGFETSSTTMSFAVYELALNPDVQRALAAEVDAALRENGGRFTYEAVMGMKYLDKVVSETLRMYPPVMFLQREVSQAYAVPGSALTLEKGAFVIVPCYALHRDPAHFPDPDRFDPERFSEEQKAARHHYAYLPFGEGPRNCIGMRFGLLQSKLGLAALLSKYEFHVCEQTEIPIRQDPKSFVTASTTGTIVRITHRR